MVRSPDILVKYDTITMARSPDILVKYDTITMVRSPDIHGKYIVLFYSEQIISVATDIINLLFYFCALSQIFTIGCCKDNVYVFANF